jgi:TctA family transporter
MTWARIAGLLQALAAHSFLLFFSGLLIAKLTPYFSISWWYVLELNFSQLQELFLFFLSRNCFFFPFVTISSIEEHGVPSADMDMPYC